MLSLITASEGHSQMSRVDEDVVEVSLLIPGWQAEALEGAAQSRGLTPGQLIRRLIWDFTEQESGV